MNHYRWIDYPKDLDPVLKARYEQVADEEIAVATTPICVVWCSEDDSWADNDGGIPDQRNCLLITHHVKLSEKEWTYGKVIKTVKFTMG